MAAKRVLIVGAGPGGLTAGMILAHRGFDVTVFEARDVVGGRNAPLKADGYTFDMGPTFLMMNFVLRECSRQQVERRGLSVLKLDPCTAGAR
jgi:phytoene desaturase